MVQENSFHIGQINDGQIFHLTISASIVHDEQSVWAKNSVTRVRQCILGFSVMQVLNLFFQGDVRDWKQPFPKL